MANYGIPQQIATWHTAGTNLAWHFRVTLGGVSNGVNAKIIDFDETWFVLKETTGNQRNFAVQRADVMLIIE